MGDIRGTGITDTIEEGTGPGDLGLHGQGETQQLYRARFKGLKFQKDTLKNVLAESRAGEVALMGSGILEYNKLLLDLKDKRLYLIPLEKGRQPDAGSWPLSPTLSEGRLAVGCIWEKALEEKIAPGDLIVKIDDVNYQDVGPCELITHPDRLLGGKRTAKLTIRKKSGEMVTISMEKK